MKRIKLIWGEARTKTSRCSEGPEVVMATVNQTRAAVISNFAQPYGISAPVDTVIVAAT